MYLMFSLIIGLTTGVTVVMSQYYGAKEADNVVKTFFFHIYCVGDDDHRDGGWSDRDKTAADRAADTG